MALIHVTPDQYIVSQWSGGTTTQVAIAPEGAVYADRDFLWRISSAVCRGTRISHSCSNK